MFSVNRYDNIDTALMARDGKRPAFCAHVKGAKVVVEITDLAKLDRKALCAVLRVLHEDVEAGGSDA